MLLVLTDFVIEIKNDVSDTGLTVSLGLGSLRTQPYAISGPPQVQHQFSLCWALNILVASEFLKTAVHIGANRRSVCCALNILIYSFQIQSQI